MKLAIMQPYFFPYLGYFSLIKHTDQFILLDTVQYIRHGWIDRNRILKQDEGWIYIQVPIIKRRGRETLIKDCIIENSHDWKQKILAQLQPYKKIAPNYFQVIKLIKEIFSIEYKDLVSLNRTALKLVCDFLELEHKILLFSEMNIEIERPGAPDEWALHICKALLDVNEYWNPPGGMSFFDKTKYTSSGIELKFQQVRLLPYDQKRIKFETGLSIIDAMMFNSVNEIHKMLNNFDII